MIRKNHEAPLVEDIAPIEPTELEEEAAAEPEAPAPGARSNSRKPVAQPKHGPAGRPMTRSEMDRITSETGKALERMPKVRVFIPKLPNVPDGQQPQETVQINGYTYQINRDQWVSVPRPVAEILAQAGHAVDLG